MLNSKFTSQKELNNKMNKMCTSCSDVYHKAFLKSNWLEIYLNIEQYSGKLWVNFQPYLTIGLRIMIVAVKLKNRHNYARIWIFLFNLFLDHIITSLFNMICPRITNKYNGCFISLFKPSELFSCQHSPPIVWK
jgi:hypothetical protein